MTEERSTATFVLVHGSWHASWMWRDVVPLLEAQGHRAVAIDLPAHGEDATPASDVTLDSYARAVCGAVNAQSEPVVLVGHSMAGVVITQAAERCPENIELLVYLCGFLPRNGEALVDLDQSGTDSLVPSNVVVDRESGCSDVRRDAIRQAFYGDCSPEHFEFAMAGWQAEPLAPLATPVRVTAERFGRIPRVYIECLEDRAVAPALQRAMYEASPCREVISMHTSHSPFFSAPEDLVRHLAFVATPREPARPR